MSKTLDPTQQIESAKAQQAAAEKAAAEMEAALTALADKRRELEAEEERLRIGRLQAIKEQKAAELAAKRATMLLEPPRVTKDVAIELAQQVLTAFESEDYLSTLPERPAPLQPSQLWETIDTARARLLTQTVDDDAQLIVLSVEAIIRQADAWEHHRAGNVPTEVGAEGIGLGRDPRDNRAVGKLLRELHKILEGRPAPKVESIGKLCSENVDFGQVARIVGLVDPTGQPALHAIAALIDRGRPTGRSWLCARWLGFWDLESAWKIRQSMVPIYRQKRADEVGGIALDAHRPGREDGTGVLRKRRLQQEEEEQQQLATLQRLRDERRNAEMLA